MLSLWCRAVGDGVLSRQLVDNLFYSVWNISIDLVLSQWVTPLVVHARIGLGCVWDEKWGSGGGYCVQVFRAKERIDQEVQQHKSTSENNASENSRTEDRNS